LHAKTAVADGRWCRIGSSNLNLASWIGNCELDIAVEDTCFAELMQSQYETDLDNATEIVLGGRRRVLRQAPRPAGGSKRRGGSSSRAAAGALRLAHTMGAAISNRRILGATESTSLAGGALLLAALGIVAILWPAIIAWPLAVLAIWFAVILLVRYVSARSKTVETDAD
jgi:cardiolipin synthase A/B